MKRDTVGLNKTAFRVATIFFFVVVFLLLVNTNMRKGLSHDEHMYIAGGHLLASESLLPYKDYPYLQMPNLALLYGFVFSITNHLLLAARLLNTLFATLMLGAIFCYATGLLSNAGNIARWLVGAGTVLLILFNPLFVYASGLAMNHDLPVLLTVLAAILCLRALLAGQPSARTWLLCGLLVGVAAGTRLSYALTLVPFTLAILILPDAVQRTKLNRLAIFLAGTLLGLLPTIFLVLSAPTAFAFDNWTYHQVNHAYWQQQGYDRAMDVVSKLAYLKDVIAEPGNLALLAGFLLLGVPAFVVALRNRQRAYMPLAFIAVLVAALLIGALAPSPTWYQYYYALVPVLAVGVVLSVSSLQSDERWRQWNLAVLGLAVVVSGAYGPPAYLRLNDNLSPESWVPIETHRIGIEIKQVVGEGRVATLAPLFPLEGGVRIYEELASGPFVWRVAPLLDEQQRSELNILSVNNLDDFLNADPPQGILTGFEDGLEAPLIEYAMQNGYRPSTLSNGATLWLP